MRVAVQCRPRLLRPSVTWVLSASAACCSILSVGHADQTPRSSVKTINDCGPQTLSTVLADRRIVVSAEAIAQLAGTDDEGTTMLGLKQAAEHLGLKAQGMRLSQPELASYVNGGYSVIAFVHPHHYVWVKRVEPRGVLIKDTAPDAQLIPPQQWERMCESGDSHRLESGGIPNPTNPDGNPGTAKESGDSHRLSRERLLTKVCYNTYTAV